MREKIQPMERVQYFQKVLDVDVEREYERLKDFSKIPVDELTDSHAISAHINRASRNAHVAFLLYLKARREYELFELEYQKEMRDLSRIALARVTEWMEGAELVRKQITKDMISEEIAAGLMTADRYKNLVQKKQEMMDIRDAMQNFSQIWNDRKSSLQTQASLARTKREVVLGKE